LAHSISISKGGASQFDLNQTFTVELGFAEVPPKTDAAKTSVASELVIVLNRTILSAKSCRFEPRLC